MSNPVSIYSGTFRATIYPEKLRTMTLAKLKKFFKLLDTLCGPENERARRVIRDTLSQQVEDAEKELRRAVQSRASETVEFLHEGQSIWNQKAGFMVMLSTEEIKKENKKRATHNESLKSAVKKAEREFKRAQKIMCYFEQIVH